MKIYYLFFWVSCFTLLSACTTANVNEIVLEKSADPTPSWINESGELNSKNKEYVNIVYSRGDLYNLPLGLKQSQAIATKKISYLVFTDVQKQILHRLEKINYNTQNNAKNTVSLSLSSIINKSFSNFKVDPPLAEQVYWEYRQQERTHESRSYYVVWVLLLIPKTVYDNAFRTIAYELQNSNDEVAVILGNDILQKPQIR